MESATASDFTEISSSSITLNINQVDDSSNGLAASAKILLLSPDLQKEHKRVRTLHSFPEASDRKIVSYYKCDSPL